MFDWLATRELAAMSVRRREVACAFGVVLRNIRRERDMSQEMLAARADLDRTYRGTKKPTLSLYS
jgi:hypothetical protein